jgi:hypothetical protein
VRSYNPTSKHFKLQDQNYWALPAGPIFTVMLKKLIKAKSTAKNKK